MNNKKQNKFYKWCNKNAEYIAVVAILFLIPFVLVVGFYIANWVAINWPKIDINNNLNLTNNTWLSFWGSYIGGMATLIALTITIKFEINRIKESRRLDILPCFIYSIEKAIGECKKHCDNIKVRGSLEDKYKYRTLVESCFLLKIKNVGIKCANDFRIISVESDGTKLIGHFGSDNIDVGSIEEYTFKIGIKSNTYIAKDISGKIKFTISYKDILDNIYLQSITGNYYLAFNGDKTVFFTIDGCNKDTPELYSKKRYEDYIKDNTNNFHGAKCRMHILSADEE